MSPLGLELIERMFPWEVGYEPVTDVFEAGRAGVGHHVAHHKYVSRRAHDGEHKGQVTREASRSL